MNKRAINKRVVDEWKRAASDRKTAVFCSTVAHAEDWREESVEQGVKAETVKQERLIKMFGLIS